jgi:hypothetical protein
MKAALPRVKGKAPNLRPSRVQRGNPECPHHHHTITGEHPGALDRPNGHGADHRATARYGAPPRPAVGLPGGAVSIDLRLAG